MIDLHCHILPGIDDGAADLDDSLEMARQAAADGIRTICATPHIRDDHDVRIDELGDRVTALNDAIRAAGIPVEVARGAEVAETAVGGLDADELASVTLGDGGWVLLEPGPGPLSDSLEAAVEVLETAAIRVLIAHPERHIGADLYERLRRLVDRGALIQATAAYLAHPETAPGMASLAGAGLIHVLGSDAHSSRFGRAAELSEGLASLARIEPTASHRAWVESAAPEAILAGEPVEIPFEPTR